MTTDDTIPSTDAELPEDSNNEASINDDAPALKAIPAIVYYQKTYGASCGNNDQKAIKLYKEFENRDKMQRLKLELHAVTKGRVSDELLVRAVGAARKGRFGGFPKWAMFVLNALNSRG